MTDRVKYQKADLIKRFVAFMIDYIIAGLISVIPFIGAILGTAYMLLRDGLDFEFMRNRSIGKTLLRLKVIELSGDKKTPDLTVSVQRNWIFALPIALAIFPLIGWIFSIIASIVIYIVEGVKVINEPDGRRLGDNFGNTIVIEEEKESKTVPEEPIQNNPT
jgi:uncharacterized RDD family membrane protein YckC